MLQGEIKAEKLAEKKPFAHRPLPLGHEGHSNSPTASVVKAEAHSSCISLFEFTLLCLDLKGHLKMQMNA